MIIISTSKTNEFVYYHQGKILWISHYVRRPCIYSVWRPRLKLLSTVDSFRLQPQKAKRWPWTRDKLFTKKTKTKQNKTGFYIIYERTWNYFHGEDGYSAQFCHIFVPSTLQGITINPLRHVYKINDDIELIIRYFCFVLCLLCLLNFTKFKN